MIKDTPLRTNKITPIEMLLLRQWLMPNTL